MKLDRKSPIPLYYQLAERIKELIQSGILKPGEQLPSERDLSEQAVISRMTVRQAVAYLVREGVLVVKQGVGTFVAEPKFAHNTLHLLGFTEEVMQQGGVVTSHVLEQDIVVPPASVVAGLSLGPEEQAVKIVRLRCCEETPLLLETIFLPARLCPDLTYEDLATNSLYALLEQQYMLHLNHARQTLEATVANLYESQIFGIKPGMAMILLEGVTYDHQDHPVEYFKAVYRGDRFKFELGSRRGVSVESSPVRRVSVLFE